jgi:hypothetical protein
MTADFQIDTDARVLITVPELMKQLLLSNDAAFLRGIDCVILDEFHFIQEATRGAEWEFIILLLPPRVSIIALSATLDQPEIFVDWVNQRCTANPEASFMRLITPRSFQRPIPLRHHYLKSETTLKSVHPLLLSSDPALGSFTSEDVSALRAAIDGVIQHQDSVVSLPEQLICTFCGSPFATEAKFKTHLRRTLHAVVAQDIEGMQLDLEDNLEEFEVAVAETVEADIVDPVDQLDEEVTAAASTHTIALLEDADVVPTAVENQVLVSAQVVSDSVVSDQPAEDEEQSIGMSFEDTDMTTDASSVSELDELDTQATQTAGEAEGSTPQDSTSNDVAAGDAGDSPSSSAAAFVKYCQSLTDSSFVLEDVMSLWELVPNKRRFWALYDTFRLINSPTQSLTMMLHWSSFCLRLLWTLASDSEKTPWELFISPGRLDTVTQGCVPLNRLCVRLHPHSPRGTDL